MQVKKNKWQDDLNLYDFIEVLKKIADDKNVEIDIIGLAILEKHNKVVERTTYSDLLVEL